MLTNNNYFVLDGRSTREFRVGLSGSGVFRSAERAVDVNHIPGRSGDLLSDTGAFFNRTMIYPCWIAHSFKTDFDSFRSFLMAHSDKYYVLTDTYHPDHFFLARVVGPIDPEVMVRQRAGTFDVTFDCKPQFFRLTGNAAVSGNSITNPTLFPCYPLITVSGSGTLDINGQHIVVDTNDFASITIDCETMDAYSGTSNANGVVSLPLECITLDPGANAISASGLTVSIVPRWYDM